MTVPLTSSLGVLVVDQIGSAHGTHLYVREGGIAASFTSRHLPDTAAGAPVTVYRFVDDLPKDWVAATVIGEETGGPTLLCVLDAGQRRVPAIKLKQLGVLQILEDAQ